MKIIFFIFLLLISYGCQPKGNLDFININNNQNKVITSTNQTEKEKKIPVFLALGMGDSNNPDPIFIIPLKRARM